MKPRSTRPTAVSGALMAGAGLLQVLFMLTGNRWLVLGAAAVVGVVITGQLFRPDLSGVGVCLDGDGRARAGGDVGLVLHVHNRGRRALPATRLQLVVSGTEQPSWVDVDPVGPQGMGRAQLTASVLGRGLYRGSVVSASSTDPLGLVRSSRAWSADRRLVVVPAAATPATPVLSGVRTPTGRTSSVTGTEELAGLRPWREGEDQRAVHWRASARRGRLVVVERDVPDVRGRWVLVLVGTPTGEADESVLATAAATWVDQVRRGHDVCALAWQPDGTRHPPPHPAPDDIEDWFAGIGDLAVPHPAAVLQSIPEGTDALTALASTSTPPSWVEELARLGATEGVRVLPGLARESR